MHLKFLSDITITIIMIYTGINSCTKGVGFAEAIKSCVKKMHYFFMLANICLLLFFVVFVVVVVVVLRSWDKVH